VSIGMGRAIGELATKRQQAAAPLDRSAPAGE